MPGISEIEIPKHYVPTFLRNIRHAPQYEMSILRPHVEQQPADGEAASPVDIYGAAKGQKKEDRFGDTPIMDVTRDRPWTFPSEYEWGTLIDKADKLKQVLDPTSPLVKACKMALDRDLDDNIIAPAFFGGRFRGKDVATAIGAGAQAFDSNNVVANTVGSSGGATPVGMNYAKIKAGIKRFKKLKVDTKRERVKLGITSQQWDELMDDVKIISRDYGLDRDVGRAELPSVLNVDFVEYEEWPIDGSNDRSLPMWVQSGLVLQDWATTEVMIAPDPGKRFNIRVYAKFMAGAVRAEQEKVIKIVCREP